MAKKTVNRKSNPAAKNLSSPAFHPRKTKTKQQRENQQRYRNKQDPEGDYENLDDWLLREQHHG